MKMVIINLRVTYHVEIPDFGKWRLKNEIEKVKSDWDLTVIGPYSGALLLKLILMNVN